MPAEAPTARPENMAGTAMERSTLYGFLSTIFREEPTPRLLWRLTTPRFMAALSGAGVEFENDFLKCPLDGLREDLAVEYTRLFIGPGKHVSPHASVHLAGEGGLWGRSTIEVRSLIHSVGFRYRPKYRGLPDHISVELELMERLTKGEGKAWQKGRFGEVSDCLESEGRFVDDHLSAWVPSFCAKVVDMARLSFYRNMAILTADFIHSERDEITRRQEEAAARKHA